MVGLALHLRRPGLPKGNVSGVSAQLLFCKNGTSDLAVDVVWAGSFKSVGMLPPAYRKYGAECAVAFGLLWYKWRYRSFNQSGGVG